MAQIVPLIILIPALGAFINTFWGSRLEERQSALVGIFASTGAFIVALLLFFNLMGNNYQEAVINPFFFDGWIRIPSAGVEIPWQMRVDTLSVTMMLVITGVGSLIHVYAMGYMHGDPRFSRFFTYLNMFLAFMLVLVTGNNFLMLFVGWEGVGLSSYLLIGFWFDKAHGEGYRNANAARKAFIANRVGDFGLLMAIFLIFWTFGTLDFYKAAEVVNTHALTGAAASQNAGHGDEHGSDASHGAEDSHSTTEDGHASIIVLTGASLQETHGEATDAHGSESASEHGETDAHGASPDAPVYLNNDHIPTELLGVFGKAERMLAENATVQFGPFSLGIGAVITLITLFMLLGATGKSAQIPLFIWLPDAMAGPTPVSALIHAATMVTAGVYMMVRSNVLFHASDTTSFIVAIIGATTALMAGYIALGQWDIKKVLAYSTVSQLGFMVAAVGFQAYVPAMFHLVTHAFFKALLFLGSGSVIHGMEHGHHHLHDHHKNEAHHDGHDHDEHAIVEHDAFDPQDMRYMGGLARRMPLTYLTYLIGTLALAGIFPFAGFWSKDEILADAFLKGVEDGGLVGAGAFIALGMLLIAAGFTAFYMWRQMELVFYGDHRHDAAAHAPESAPSMILPLLVLAFFSLTIGFMNTPSGIGLAWIAGGAHRFADWIIVSVQHAHVGVFLPLLALVALSVGIGAILLARSIYGGGKAYVDGTDALQKTAFAPGFQLSSARLYWDEIYFALFITPFIRASKFFGITLDWNWWHDGFHHALRDLFNGFGRILARPIESGIIDATVLGVGRLATWVSSRMRRIQTGYVRTYAVVLLSGAILVIIALLIPLFQNGG